MAVTLTPGYTWKTGEENSPNSFPKKLNAMFNGSISMGSGFLLGRYSSGTGPAQEVTVGSGLSLSGVGVLTATGGGGSVTSIDVSGGTTGLTYSGGPVTASGVITLAGDLVVANGGTGVATLTAYAPIFGGTTATGPVQSGTVGTATQVLTSNGPGALPTFQAASGSSPLTTKGDLFGFSTVNARIPVGADNLVLTADSSTSLGVKWAAGSGTVNSGLIGQAAYYAATGSTVSGTTGLTFSSLGETIFAPTARNAPSPYRPYMEIDLPADTLLPAGGSAIGIVVKGAIRQWASNTSVVLGQNEITINPPTYTFAAPTGTIAFASTLAVVGPPIASTNAIITSPYALLIQSGNIGVGNGTAANTPTIGSDGSGGMILAAGAGSNKSIRLAADGVAATLGQVFTGIQSSTISGGGLAMYGDSNPASTFAIRAAAFVPNITFSRAGGTMASPSSPLTGDLIGIMAFGGRWGGSTWNDSAARITYVATANWSSTVASGKFVFAPNNAGTRTDSVAILETGQISQLISIASTSTTTGSIITAGGIGAAGAGFFGAPVVVKNYTVAGLPSAATYQYGFAFVTDAVATAITGLGLAPIGGGTNKVPVYSDGTNWLII